MVKSTVAPCSPAEARRWATGGVAFSPGEGQVLLYAGHRPFGVYVLLEGRLRCLKTKGGRTRVMGRIEAPATVGRGLLRTGLPSPVTIQTSGKTRVVFLAPDVLASMESRGEATI
jgi:CRP-like cAMP-binding protein